MEQIKAEVLELWPELEWIKNDELRIKTAKVWEKALEKSVLTPEDLNRIPFTLLVRTRSEGLLHGPQKIGGSHSPGKRQ